MNTPIERAEHEEFCKRVEEEHKRQNKRIDILEEGIKRLDTLNTSIEKLALNMESMLKEQMQQGERLEELESRDGKMWRNVVGYAITAIVGIVIGFIFKHFGM